MPTIVSDSCDEKQNCWPEVAALRRSACMIVFAATVIMGTAFAQSTAARVSGIVYDEQQAVVPGAAITLKNLDTGQVRDTVSAENGSFGLVGLVPGHYQMRVALSGFATVVRSIDLTINEDVELNPTLSLATVESSVEVTADVPLLQPSKIELGRTIRTKQIDELPVAGRDFATLALLTPGILTNQVATGSSTGIATAAQTGKNNTYLVDGLTLDSTSLGSARGGVSPDAVKEFVVLSNNFSAEYGQASGAIVSVVTRSGTNERAGRVYYYHRDDRLDATSHAARLASPALEESTFEQKIVGGFLGGPIVHDRAFFFGSVDHTMLNTEAIVTSAVLQTFRPAAPTHLPVEQRVPKVLGRSDLTLSSAQVLTARYRLQQSTLTNSFGSGDVGLAAPERAFDVSNRQYDFAVLHNLVSGTSRLNEFRFQFARGAFDRDPRCPGCPAEERPSIKLGKLSAVPNGQTEDRWQFADSFTYLLPRTLGEHSLKAGIDVSVIGLDARGVNDGDGTFTFSGRAGDSVFDPARAATYPTLYTRTRTFFDPNIHLDHNLYTAFVQDRWKPRVNVTLNLGLRWDYDAAPGISNDVGDIAPRVGVAFDPTSRGKTSIRAGVGRYYDQVPLSIAGLAAQAKTSVQILIQNPGYPDPFGLNPNGNVFGSPSTTRLVDMRVPYTDQFTIGVQRALWSQMAVTADVVEARGRHLPVTHDLNYPDLNEAARPRPDPNFQRVIAVESRGNSWYRGLQIGLEKRHSRGHSYSVAYTFSKSERDTEDSSFVPQDQRDFTAERGPAANDARHRFSAGLNVDLPLHVRFTGVMTAQSALAYTITTGSDDNRDTNLNDRPPGVGRNSERGADFQQVDARLSKSFRMGATRIEALVEAFNLTNRANWTGYDGKQNSRTFGRPKSALPARQVQLGIRVDF